jgi:hypothetical protein
MDIIKLKLNERLTRMVKEVGEEYQLSPDQIILNTLEHFIKDKKDFLVGRQFELKAIVRQKQLEYEKSVKALELHNATIANFEQQTEPTVVERKPIATMPIKKPEEKLYIRRGKFGKQEFEFTDKNLKTLKDEAQSYYYDTLIPQLQIKFNRNNKKSFYSSHSNQKMQKGNIKCWIGSTDKVDVTTARKIAEKNETLVQQCIDPNKVQTDVETGNLIPLETDSSGMIMWKEFVNYRYSELDIMGIALEDNKVNVEQCKRKFRSGVFSNTAQQAFDMWKNDNMTIGQICHKQLMDAGTPEEKPCSVANMLMSRILKAIWHFGTDEERSYIFRDGGES